MNKQYLGDGVYIQRDLTGSYMLTTENGMGITNTIFLEGEVIKNLLDYIKPWKPVESKPFGYGVEDE